MGTDTLNAIQTLGFPIIAAAMCGLFCWKVTFYILKDLQSEIRNCYDIIVKLIDSTNGVRKEICRLEQRLAELREQHRNFSNLYSSDSSRPRVHKSKER